MNELKTPDNEFKAPEMPDNSRRARNSGNPRNIGRKLWLDKNEEALITELAHVYSSNNSALIRWLISLGIERVNELAQTDPAHISLHDRSRSPMAS